MFKKVLSCALAVILAVMACPNFSSNAENVKTNAQLGSLLETIDGTPGETVLSYSSAEEMLNDMEKVVERGNLELYFNADNMTLGVKNRATGEIYTSNPYDAAGDSMYTGDVKKNLDSQVILTFYDSDYQKLNMWSSADCLEYGQYKAELYENGIALELSIGEDKGNLVVPTAITPEDYDKYTKDLENRDQRKLRAMYTLYAKGEYDNEEMLKKYPSLKEEELYILEGELTDSEKEDVNEIFTSAGYTYELYEKSMEALDIAIEKTVYPNFKLRVEYVLTESGLSATIPNDSIVCSDGFQLLEISLLPYFGCDKPENGKNGYMFVPDGSGAIININSQDETRQTAIAGRVYGENPVTDDPSELPTGENYYLPVFGVVRNDGSAFTAIVTSGDAADYIAALLGGPNGRYYTVYNRFIYTESESTVTHPKIVSMGSTRDIYKSDENRYTCDYSVTYSFLAGENANYTGMAAVYRDYLTEKGFGVKATADDAEVSIRTIGAALIEKDFLGFPYHSEAVFTTYKDIITILSDLKEEGIGNLSLSLRGWEKDGLDASISNKIRFSSKQGGKKGYKELAAYCKQEGIELSLGNEFVLTKHNRLFDGFGVKSSSSQTLEYSTAEFFEYRSFTELKENALYITSPVKYKNYAKSLTKSAVKSDLETVTLNSLGNYLVADFSKRHSINREEALVQIEELLKDSADKLSLNFDGANAYVLPFADTLENITCNSSGLPGESASIPFLQMVVSGNIRLESRPINLEGDSNIALLDCLRCGVIPTYIVAYDNIEQLKQTDYSRYFATNYNYVKEDITEAYETFGEAFKIISSGRLIDSYEVAQGVYCTVYEDDVRIYTNYNENDYKSQIGTVNAGGYLIVKE